MKRAYAPWSPAFITGVFLFLTLGGCIDRDDRRRGFLPVDPCRRYDSCGECTPARGCGWCSDGQATGICLSDPSECTLEEFSWTWEPKGCGADAGIDADASEVHTPAPDAPADSGDPGNRDAPAAAMCRWPAAANTFSATDAGPTSGCLPSTGGSLCASSRYALSCYGTNGVIASAPDSTLGCAVVPVPTPSNVLYYCCPCLPAPVP